GPPQSLDLRSTILYPRRSPQCELGPRRHGAAECGGAAAVEHDDLGADLGAVVEVGHVLVGESDTAGGHVGADGPWLVGAVDAVERILVAAPQVESARADWIFRTALHAEPAFQLHQVRSNLGLALQHFGSRIPVRPFLFGVNG